MDSIRMTFTCFFLKDTETDGKDSVFTNHLGEVSKNNVMKLYNFEQNLQSPYLIFELLCGISLFGVDAGSI